MPTPYRKYKQSPQRKLGGQAEFEKAFTLRMDLSPTDYIRLKLQSNSDLSSVQYLYEIIAAEIAMKNRCICPDFSVYYEEAKKMI